MMKKNSIFTVVLCFCFGFGLQSFAATTFCQPGNGRDNELNSCSPCAAGTFSAYGVSCNLCPAGTYAGAVSSSCSLCPSESTSKAGAISTSDCEPCLNGQVVVNGECTNPELTDGNNQRSNSGGSDPSSGGGNSTPSQAAPAFGGGPVYNQIPFGGGGIGLNAIRKVVIQKISKVVKKKKLIIKRQ